MFPTVYLAAEDVPGLAVGRRLMAERPMLSVYRAENAHGFGTLRRKTPIYDRMGARGLPVLMFTDLDADLCPASKVAAWLGRDPSKGFLFRICVRAVEAWLLADREGMAGFLQVSIDRLPPDPEMLPNPKDRLIELAQRAPRRIRVGMTPVGSATIGPDYNGLLEAFIAKSWVIGRAVQCTPSLARARRRIAELSAAVSA